MTRPVQAAADQPSAPPLAKGSPEEKLNTRGLSRSGVYFVLACEAEILGDNSSRVVEARRAQQIPAERKEELVRDFKAKWSDFLKATDELTPLFDKALGDYRQLEGDPSVKETLAEVRRSTKAAALLGPSRNLRKAIDTIKEARRTYAPESAAPKKKARSANARPAAAPKKKEQATKR
jgi:hypothetical protein